MVMQANVFGIAQGDAVNSVMAASFLPKRTRELAFFLSPILMTSKADSKFLSCAFIGKPLRTFADAL